MRDGNLTRCHSPTACCWLSTFSSARVAHHNRSTNPPTRRTFKPLLIFSTLTLETFSNQTLSLSSFSLLTLCSTCTRSDTVVSVPSDAGQWPLLSHMRLQQLPLSSTCRHRPNPTCHRHDCARPVLYMRIQNIKVGNPKYATQYLLY